MVLVIFVLLLLSCNVMLPKELNTQKLVLSAKYHSKYSISGIYFIYFACSLISFFKFQFHVDVTVFIFDTFRLLLLANA